MKKITSIALAVALTMGVAACSTSTDDTTQAKTSVEKSSNNSGINTENFNKSIRFQDDLYLSVNGNWLDRVEIPADKSNYGAFTKLRDDSQLALKKIIEQAASTTAVKGSDAQKIGDFYNSYMDIETINALGIKPLNKQLSEIENAQDHGDIIRLMATLKQVGVGTPFGFYTGADAKNSSQNTVYVYQSGLTLPDRDYYLKDDEKFAKIRAKYQTYIKSLLSEAGYSDIDQAAKNIIDVETALAEIQWSRVESRNATKRYNKMTRVELNKLMGSFDWSLFATNSNLYQVEELIVSQPSFMAGFGKAFNNTSVQAWQDYLTFHLVDGYAELLSQQFIDMHFDFHSKTLNGVEEQRPRWKQAVDTTDGVLGEVVGKLYVKEYFKPEAKERMETMINMLIKGFEVSITELDWMSDATKVEAQDKLSKFTYKIGYPDKWRDYSALEVVAGDLVANYQRYVQFEYNESIDEIGMPVDKTKWGMTPQTVNAYFNPVGNEIVFPAAILQPPFFNMDADDAVNYGGIGAVIGHELSHGFDDQGAKYDGEGNLRNWWTDADKAEFEKRSKQLSDQYTAFAPFSDAHVNGDLTLGENIGDLGGLTVAFRSYLLSLNGKKSTVIDGFTGEQRVFIGWSQVWRRKYRDEALRNRLMTDPHSPGQYRAFGTPRNIEAFYKAFDLKEGDKMYLKPADRVKIW
ncbi:MAG: M13 family metallopeptidase [Gammaproteobacteria bacterium]|nr:M13 family metallopeptidase [Gammaproteobacteria bacterium]